MISEGWHVVHNTRHSPLEFGKDVIARDPAGQLYAIQLKGNPGSRLKKSEAQEMLPQITELLDVPVPAIYRRTAGEKHIAVVATNGEIDEEARVLFESIASRTANPLCPATELCLWARGDLLRRFGDKLLQVWPTTLTGMRRVLELYTSDGTALVDPQRLSEILKASVGRPTSTMKSPEKTSKISAALLLGEIIKAPWYSTENHYVLYQISVLISVYCLRYADTGTRRELVRAYDAVILEHAAALLKEGKERNFDPQWTWAQASPMDEIDIMRERLRLVADCAAALVLSDAPEIEYSRDYARELISSSYGPNSIWGQGAIPAAIGRYWAFRRLDATARPDGALMALLKALTFAARRNPEGVPAPYYSFEECLFVHSSGLLGIESDVADDGAKGRAWFALPLMYMLAKRNWKQTCKNLWAGFSKLLHETTKLPHVDFFDASLSDDARVQTIQLYSGEWANLVSEAVSIGAKAFPEEITDRAWLLSAYVAIVPYRASTSVLMWLDAQLSRTWYSEAHLPS
jgi:hypothetical protein